MMELLLYCVIGVFAGFLGGLLGIGGGLVTVPSLFFVFQWLGFPAEYRMQAVIGTSLGAMIFTSTSSAYSHYLQKGVILRYVAYLAPGVLIGAVIGSGIADYVASRVLEIIFGCSVAIIGLYLFLFPEIEKLSPKTEVERPVLFFLSGLFIGTASTILGIGGGILTVPFLKMFHTPLRRAISTSAVLGLIIAIAGAASFLVLGLDENAFSGSIGYLYLPALFGIGLFSAVFAPLGVKLAYALPVVILRKVFGVFLILVGGSMILDSI